MCICKTEIILLPVFYYDLLKLYHSHVSTVKKKKYENYKQYEKALAGYLKSIYIEYSFVIKLTNASFNTV